MLNALRGGKMGKDEYRVLNKPRFEFYRVAALNIANGTATPIPWDTRDYDTDGMWSPALPTRFTCKTPGVYPFYFVLSWAASALGYRQLYFQKTTPAGVVTVYAPSVEQPLTGSVTVQFTSWPIPLNALDYVETVVAQGSGGALAMSVASATDRENGVAGFHASTL